MRHIRGASRHPRSSTGWRPPPRAARGIHGWTASDIPDQTGRTFVITGANSGIGLGAARALGAKGATIVLAVRYGQAKLANMLFMVELQRRLDEAGSSVRAVGAHPGWAATNLQTRSGNKLEDTLMSVGNRLFAQTGDMGAEPTLYAATQDIPGNSCAGPSGRFGMRGHPALVGRSKAATDEATARELWTLSESLTGVSFPREALWARLAELEHR